MINYVLGFAFNKDRDKVVLIKKARPSAISGLLTAPGGKIEKDELSISAIVREFEEETGVFLNYWKNELKITCPEYTIEVFSTFSDDIMNVQTQTDEEILIMKVSDILSVDCTSDTKWLIPLILDTAHKVGTVTVVNKNV